MIRPEQARAQDAEFVDRCNFDALRERLPLCWGAPPNTPPSPKLQYRSSYQYLGWEGLEEPQVWEQGDDFALLLRLVDFSGLRDVLAAQLGWTSAKGQVPFDPISLCLLICWQIVNQWSRAQTLRNLKKERYADDARRFGFQKGIFPSEGGLRHFLTALGENARSAGYQQLNQLLSQSVALIRESGILSADTWQQALLCPDGQIHKAASRLRCQNVSESCYQQAPRVCPAKAKNFRGCDCQTLDCAQICKRAAPRDPQARFVWYTGNNQNDQKEGEGFFGYRSLPLQLADQQRRFSLTLLDEVLPANHREEGPASTLLQQLAEHYPDLQVDAVAGDAGFGYETFLHTVYQHLQARRVVNLRHHPSDEDPENWVLRGYDARGRPICPYGYGLLFNGLDYQRRRTKWVCQQSCLKGVDPKAQLPAVTYPPPDCPYQSTDHPLGRIVNLGARFPDGSIRLVRDLPVGSPSWKKLYHRARNAVEGRNATFEAWGFKRLPVFGLPRVTAWVFIADVLNNLTTMARLIREATRAHQDP